MSIRINLVTLVVVAAAVGVVIIALVTRIRVLGARLRQATASHSEVAAPKSPTAGGAATVPAAFIPAGSASATETGQGDYVSQVAALLQAGQKITAIKVLREATGLGLKEAKDAVEAIARGLHIP